MRYVSTDGQVLRELRWTCGECEAVVFPNLIWIEGGKPMPFDVPINCENCLKLIAVFNPAGVNPLPAEAPPRASWWRRLFKRAA